MINEQEQIKEKGLRNNRQVRTAKEESKYAEVLIKKLLARDLKKLRASRNRYYKHNPTETQKIKECGISV